MKELPSTGKIYGTHDPLHPLTGLGHGEEPFLKERSDGLVDLQWPLCVYVH